MTSFKIRVANVLDVHPNPINCLSLNESTLKVALFRGGEVPAIEIWDVSNLPYLEKVLLDLDSDDEKPSVESIVWAQNRLFSCGLHGFVVEHDLVSRTIKGRSAATSGPVWCLGVNPEETHLAAGTEDGFVNIFQVIDEELIYLKVLDRQEGRVLSLSWSPCANFIATGSIDSVRLWDVEKGHALQRLITGRSKNKETIVWSILLLDDFTIVSGDSRGIVSFWDGRMGVLKYKVYSHKADILSLKLSTDKSAIYATGVDPTVVMLVKTGKNGDKWVKSHQRNIHINDVMCLATYGNKLFSAGIDADFVVSSFPPKIVTKYPPLPKLSIFLAKKTKQLLVQKSKGIEIWQLPEENQELFKLLEIESFKQKAIYSSCLSPSGRFFGYSVEGRISFFQLLTSSCGKMESITNIPTLEKLRFKPQSVEPFLDLHENRVWSLHFISDNQPVAVAMDGSKLAFMEISTENSAVNVKNVISLDQSVSENGIDMIVTSDSTNCIAMSSAGSIFIYEVANFAVSQTISVPKYRCQSSTLNFHPGLPLILIAYVDRTVKIFNYRTGKFILDTLIKRNAEAFQPILGSSWASNGKMAMLFEIDGMHLMEMGQEEGGSRKKIKKNNGSTDDDGKYSFSVISCVSKYKFIVFLEFLDDGEELLAVEVKPNSLLEKLPPAFIKKRFGM